MSESTRETIAFEVFKLAAIRDKDDLAADAKKLLEDWLTLREPLMNRLEASRKKPQQTTYAKIQEKARGQ